MLLIRSYTGPWLALYASLSVLFVLPHVATTALWTGVAAVEERYLPPSPPLPSGVSLVEWPVWQVMLGLHRDDRVATTLLLFLLIFNLGRAFLTWKVSVLRHEQEVSGAAPPRADYWYLVRMSPVVTLFGLGAVLISGWTAINWLSQTVRIPTW
jgi:hypothetical protein